MGRGTKVSVKGSVRIVTGDTCVEVLDENGHDLEDEAYEVARKALDEAGEIGGGEVYHPSDGDTYIYEPENWDAVVGVLVRRITENGFQVICDAFVGDSEPDAET